MSRPLRTEVVSAWDYHQDDLTPFCVPFEADRKELADDLLSLQKKYASRVPADRVEEGDVVTLCCRSKQPKFQKDSVTVSVGKGLYSKELEAQLPGMAAGQERELTAGGARVVVRVLDIKRAVLPELTDEFVDRTFPGLHSRAELED